MEKKWVIVFLIYADFRSKANFSMDEKMKTEINILFKDIMTTPIDSDRIRLYVVMNGIKYLFRRGTEPVIETKTMFYEITRKKNKKENKIANSFIIDSAVFNIQQKNPVNDLQNAKKLACILKNIVVKDDEEVLFVTWDHGSAFGVFRFEIPELPTVRNPIHEENDLKKFPFLNLFWQKIMKDSVFKNFIEEEKNRYYIPEIQLGNELFIWDENKEISDFCTTLLLNKQYHNSFLINNEGDQVTLQICKEKFIKTQEEAGDNKFIDQHEIVEHLEKNGAKLMRSTSEVTEILKNEELAMAFQFWLGEKKVAVLLMMNCWMTNLHTMYSMREQVEYLVAPQSDIAIPGYNYRDILRYINGADSRFDPPGRLAEVCVEATENKFARNRAAKFNNNIPGINIIDTWKIFAIELNRKNVEGQSLFQKQIEELSRVIDIIIKGVKSGKPEELKYLLKYVRSVCFDFTNHKSMMIDIVNWLLSVKYANEDFMPVKVPPEIITAIVLFRDMIIRKDGKDSLIVKETEGKSLYANPDKISPLAVINSQPTGYSLFFPIHDLSSPVFNKLRDNIEGDSFMNDFLKNWKEFLNIAIDNKIIF